MFQLSGFSTAYRVTDTFDGSYTAFIISNAQPTRTNFTGHLMRFVRNMNSRQFIAYWLMNASFNQTTSIWNYRRLSINLDIPVLCYGLRTDFRGELFIGSQYLLAWSDKLVELKPSVFVAEKKAGWRVGATEQALTTEGEGGVVGGNGPYVSVCRKHYKEALEVGSLTAIQERHRHD